MKRVLVIDDDQLILQSIAFNLKDENYEILTAADGYHALELVDKSKVDVIICDIMMPTISGLGILSLLKNFYLNNIPVIIISSLNKEDVEPSALDMGASSFMAKPLDYEELTKTVKKLSSRIIH
ncbi:MAG TPA: response regulator [Bacteroidia bacterium]|jgi:DNA-binding response OmpR family regulator|nr:response regulator [Bacteroidia bacterium]